MKNMMNEKITLLKKNGLKYTNILAHVQANMIFTADAKHPVEDGDVYERILPNGVVEEYIIESSGYNSGIGSISEHYQSKVKKKSSIKNSEPLKNIYNISGANSRVNINSVDNSHNISELEASKIFKEIFKLIELVENNKDKQNLKISATELQKYYGKPLFLEKYKSFMSVAANHIGVFQPILSSLSSLI